MTQRPLGPFDMPLEREPGMLYRERRCDAGKIWEEKRALEEEEWEAAAAAPRPAVGETPTADLIEAVSAQVHADWMRVKSLCGVTSRKSESGEELMVPYGQLSEQAKDLDRGTVRSVLSTLPKLGFAVVVKTPFERPDR